MRRDKPKHPIKFSRKLLSFFVHILVWIGIAVVYYFAFSFFFDTPIESGMKRSVAQLELQYDSLTARYDTIERVLDNVVERDKHLFKNLFDSYPLEYNDPQRQMARYDTLVGKTNRELSDDLMNRLSAVEERARLMRGDFDILNKRIEVRGMELNHVPSIQPVNNRDLSRIATSYGMRIHPFYKTLSQHNGIDFVVPEDTRVFATADGTVARLREKRSNAGQTIVISHGGGYETTYNHLSKILVREGTKVKRGDIIALSGNTGLSLAPHLHYEVSFNGMRVDPVHYFFYELNQQQYDKVKRLSAVGMQSFD